MTREELDKCINELETALDGLYMERENREKIFRKEKFQWSFKMRYLSLVLNILLAFFSFVCFVSVYGFGLYSWLGLAAVCLVLFVKLDYRILQVLSVWFLVLFFVFSSGFAIGV